MDDPDGGILSLASDDGEVVAGFIQKNARHPHMLPQARAFFHLFGRQRYFFCPCRWNLTQSDVIIKTRSWAAIPVCRDYPEGLLVLLVVSRMVVSVLSVQAL